MKTVTFEGQEYEVPEWAHWMARDDFGVVRCYGADPELYRGEEWLCSDNYSSVIRPIGAADWRESKVKV